jgi:hypothetical protein
MNAVEDPFVVRVEDPFVVRLHCEEARGEASNSVRHIESDFQNSKASW